MAYSDFTLAKVKQAFKLVVDESQSLFDEVAGVQPSQFLSLTLKEYLSLATAINTEKARSDQTKQSSLLIPIHAGRT